MTTTLQNGYVTVDEARAFCAALDDIHGSFGLLDEADVVDSQGTLADWIETWGEPEESDTADNGVTVHVWRERQKVKGDQRKDIYLAEFPGGVATHMTSA